MIAPVRGLAHAVAAMLVGAVVLVAPSTAQAQPRLEITAGGAWWDGYDLGQRRASITGPQAPTGQDVTLFDTDVAIRPGPGAEVRVGWRLFRGVYAEATGGIGVNEVEARVSGDIEQAPAVTLSSTLTQITIDGGAVVELPALRTPAGNLVPFVAGGAGYLRQVHEDRVLIETGRTFHVGAGVKWRSPALRPRGLVQRLIVRADARLVSRSGGVDVGDERRNYITVSGGVGVRLF
jgi:hypothetical protein